MSRLLILQSKRLLLTNARTRVTVRGENSDAADVARLEAAVHDAFGRYNETVLKYGPPGSTQYKLVAYSSLIAKAEVLQSRLDKAPADLGGIDREQLDAERRTLDQIVSGWRTKVRTSMASQTA